jgi:hypothetical protein
MEIEKFEFEINGHLVRTADEDTADAILSALYCQALYEVVLHRIAQSKDSSMAGEVLTQVARR